MIEISTTLDRDNPNHDTNETPLKIRRRSIANRTDFYAFYPDDSITRLPRSTYSRQRIIMETINELGE